LFLLLLFLLSVTHPSSIYPLSLHDALPIYVAIGLLAGRTVGDIGRDQEQRDRQRERRHHHPSQHDQRFALCGLHGRSGPQKTTRDRKSTRLNSSHVSISYAVFCLKKKRK